MSAFKGTPGPWFADEQCAISGWVEIRIPGYSRNPVAAATPATSGDAEARRDSETLANARLIAAAPDLLALAERVARLNRDAGEIGAGMLASLINEARAAIEKVTGGDA